MAFEMTHTAACHGDGPCWLHSAAHIHTGQCYSSCGWWKSYGCEKRQHLVHRSPWQCAPEHATKANHRPWAASSHLEDANKQQPKTEVTTGTARPFFYVYIQRKPRHVYECPAGSAPVAHTSVGFRPVTKRRLCMGYLGHTSQKSPACPADMDLS